MPVSPPRSAHPSVANVVGTGSFVCFKVQMGRKGVRSKPEMFYMPCSRLLFVWRERVWVGGVSSTMMPLCRKIVCVCGVRWFVCMDRKSVARICGVALTARPRAEERWGAHTGGTAISQSVVALNGYRRRCGNMGNTRRTLLMANRFGAICLVHSFAPGFMCICVWVCICVCVCRSNESYYSFSRSFGRNSS